MSAETVAQAALDRIMAHVDKAHSGCWIWTAYRQGGGYGATRLNGKVVTAHRAVYVLLVGDIPAGLHLDHLCRVRACVNPDHLEPVTPGENVRRGEPANRTRCPQGHDYTPDNTRVRAGKRHCLACHRTHQAAYLARKATA